MKCRDLLMILKCSRGKKINLIKYFLVNLTWELHLLSLFGSAGKLKKKKKFSINSMLIIILLQ